MKGLKISFGGNAVMAGSAVESGTGGQESSISPLPGDWLLPSLLASARV